MPDEKTSYRDYDVSGDDLGEVREEIFDETSGKGRQRAGETRRHAAWTEIDYRYVVRRDYDPATRRLTIQIIDFDWHFTIHRPRWRQVEEASEAERGEWQRFTRALETHEQGHIGIYKHGFEKVKTALKNQPAGQTVITANKDPEYNEDGTPKTPEDATIDEAIKAAVLQLITSHPDFRAMEQEQDRYDAPRSADNPTGTNHGVEQGAEIRN